MRNRALPSTKDDFVNTADLPRYLEGWLLTCEISHCSAATIEKRRLLMSKFLWFLRDQEIDVVDRLACRGFLRYLTNGHTKEGGRWGTGWNKPPAPSTVNSYHSTLRAFFNWIRTEEDRIGSPMDKVEAAIDRADQVQPFSEAQVESLLKAAKKSNHAKRDEAIILFLLDTGARISELCRVNYGELDMMGYGVTVAGKGGKTRRVQFGRHTKRALWGYLHGFSRENDDPLFIAEGGHHSGERLTRSGVLQMIRRLGRAADITGVRCSPHTFRHTFAINFLRNGGNQFSLMTILGHTSIEQTQHYVAVAEADVVRQHRQHSPVDRLMRRK